MTKKKQQRPPRTSPSDVSYSWTTKRYSRRDVETMMCLLDAWNDIENSFDGRRIAEHEEWLRDFRSEYGSYDLRHALEQLAASADEVWKQLGEHESNLVFDWEFCPAFLLHAVDWATYCGDSRVRLHSDAADRIKAHLALQDRFGKNAA